MARAKVKILYPATNYNAIKTLASNVIAAMTTNVASFPTPAPTIAALALQYAALSAAITAWGPVGARGSHADLLALRAASYTMRNMLVQEAAYVQNLVNPSDTYADQSFFISLSGFAVKNAGSPQGVLGAPENLHQAFANNVDISFAKIAFKKPLGLLSKGNVKSYTIARNLTGMLPVDADIIATTTKTSYIDHQLLGNALVYYFVCAVNDAGRGAWTAALPVQRL